MIKGVALLGLWLKSVDGRTVSEADGCLSNTAMPVKTLIFLMAEFQFNLSCSQSFRSCSSISLRTTLSQSARGAFLLTVQLLLHFADLFQKKQLILLSL